MELATLRALPTASVFSPRPAKGRQIPIYPCHLHRRQQKSCFTLSALPEITVPIALAAVAVGAAASLLARTNKTSEDSAAQSSFRTCEDCGGSGICSECNGEGFIPKKLSEETAERARMAAKNMATRYTAGLPKKWSYCSKCSSARSCTICGGTGKISL